MKESTVWHEIVVIGLLWAGTSKILSQRFVDESNRREQF